MKGKALTDQQRRRLQSALRWAQFGFLFMGLWALTLYGGVTLYTRLYQFYLETSFSRQEKPRTPPLSKPEPSSAPRKASATPKPRPVLPEGALLGRVEIARLGLLVMVMEGVNAKVLRVGAGHIPGTALPGEPGNVGISAHRDTFFRKLQGIRRQDKIQLTTPEGAYQYVVESTKIVDPEDVEVLEPNGQPMLTLVTCYPFYFVGAAPRRFIVHAYQVTGEDGPVRVAQPAASKAYRQSSSQSAR